MNGQATTIRSFVALREVLEQRLQASRTGVLWVPPAKGALIEVEVQEGDEKEWRRGEVRRLYPDGRFQVCIHTRCGVPDEDFIEWYARVDEGREWRRIASAPAPPPG